MNLTSSEVPNYQSVDGLQEPMDSACSKLSSISLVRPTPDSHVHESELSFISSSVFPFFSLIFSQHRSFPKFNSSHVGQMNSFSFNIGLQLSHPGPVLLGWTGYRSPCIQRTLSSLIPFTVQKLSFFIFTLFFSSNSHLHALLKKPYSS